MRIGDWGFRTALARSPAEKRQCRENNQQEIAGRAVVMLEGKLQTPETVRGSAVVPPDAFEGLGCHPQPGFAGSKRRGETHHRRGHRENQPRVTNRFEDGPDGPRLGAPEDQNLRQGDVQTAFARIEVDTADRVRTQDAREVENARQERENRGGLPQGGRPPSVGAREKAGAEEEEDRQDRQRRRFDHLAGTLELVLKQKPKIVRRQERAEAKAVAHGNYAHAGNEKQPSPCRQDPQNAFAIERYIAPPTENPRAIDKEHRRQVQNRRETFPVKGDQKDDAAPQNEERQKTLLAQELNHLCEPPHACPHLSPPGSRRLQARNPGVAARHSPVINLPYSNLALLRAQQVFATALKAGRILTPLRTPRDGSANVCGQ